MPQGVGQIGRVGDAVAGGTQFLSRIWDASGTITVPAKTGWMTVRCLGAGGDSQTNGKLGGGGGLAKAGVSVFPSDTVVANQGAPCTDTAIPTVTNVTKNGTIVCSATSGLRNASSSVNGQPGSGTVGDILRSGAPAANGFSTIPYASTPASDTGDFDSVGLGFNGTVFISGFSSSTTITGTCNAFRGSGGYGQSSGNLNSVKGQIVIDFWTAKPFTYTGN